MTDLNTKEPITWCPGCPNFMILASVKKALGELIKKGYKQEDFTMVTDIGCNAKIYDYINISGIYGLHGRALATAFGITLGNPNLHVLAFMGDGGCYSEGMSHFMHAGRYNSNMTLIVHDNQSFSLTTGQATGTSQQGFKTKAEPLGEFNKPLNPVKIALAADFSFVARCNARDIEHTAEILEKAIKHKGFSFVEIIQDCIIFNPEINNKDSLMYKVKDNSDKKTAEKLVEEWDYNGKSGKIPLGVIYQKERLTLEDEWPQLKTLRDKKRNWEEK
ncbi:MAG: thiamine pyrophosphate-dependent enzyme [Candidatus Pacearchaeota archaeon]